MSREDYADLIHDFCEEVGLDDAGELLNQGVLQAGEALIGIEYLDERREVRLLMDLGNFEMAEGRDALFSLLLHISAQNNGLYLPIFSIHPENGHAIVAYCVPLKILREKSIGLAFVLEEQLVPLLHEWKTAILQALGECATPAEKLCCPSEQLFE